MRNPIFWMKKNLPLLTCFCSKIVTFYELLPKRKCTLCDKLPSVYFYNVPEYERDTWKKRFYAGKRSFDRIKYHLLLPLPLLTNQTSFCGCCLSFLWSVLYLAVNVIYENRKEAYPSTQRWHDLCSMAAYGSRILKGSDNPSMQIVWTRQEINMNGSSKRGKKIVSWVCMIWKVPEDQLGSGFNKWDGCYYFENIQSSSAVVIMSRLR